MREVLRLIRWYEWCDSKLAIFILTYYYLLLFYHRVELFDIVLMLPLTVLYISSAAFGYMINDYSDKTVDKIAGKKTVMNSLKEWQQILVIMLVLFVCIVSFLPFLQHTFAVISLFLSYLTAFLYSIKPFRLKERGAWGIIFASLAQRVLPIILIFSIFNHFQLDTLFFLILCFLIGIRWILIHQLHDRHGDLKAKIKTFTVHKGAEKSYYALIFFFIMELFSIGVFIGILTLSITSIIPLVIGYSLFQLYLYPLWNNLGLKRILTSYDFAPLNDFYSFWFPVWMSLLLAIKNPLFLIITVIEVYWKLKFIKFDFMLIKLRNKNSKTSSKN